MLTVLPAWSGYSRTCRPFGKRYSVTPSMLRMGCALTGALGAAAKAAAPANPKRLKISAGAGDSREAESVIQVSTYGTSGNGRQTRPGRRRTANSALKFH